MSLIEHIKTAGSIIATLGGAKVSEDMGIVTVSYPDEVRIIIYIAISGNVAIIIDDESGIDTIFINEFCPNPAYNIIETLAEYLVPNGSNRV